MRSDPKGVEVLALPARPFQSHLLSPEPAQASRFVLGAKLSQNFRAFSRNRAGLEVFVDGLGILADFFQGHAQVFVRKPNIWIHLNRLPILSDGLLALSGANIDL